MWSKKAIIGPLVGCLVVLPIIASAQSESEPRQDFFENGFVNGGFESPSETSAPQPSPAPSPNRLQANSPLAQMKAVVPGIVPSIKSNTDHGKTDGVIVQSIGMLVSSNNPEHLKKSLKSLVDFSLKHKVPLERVHALGSYKLPKDDALDQMLAATWILDGQFSVIPKLPEGYNQIQNSPAWLINTDQGQYVLEAPSDPEAYFDEDGHFVPRNPTVAKEDLIGNIE